MTEQEKALEQARDVISKAKTGEGIASELPDIMADAILEARAQEAEREIVPHMNRYAKAKWMNRAAELRAQKGKV